MPDIETPDFEGPFEEYAQQFIGPIESALACGEGLIDVDNFPGGGVLEELNKHFDGRAAIAYEYCGPRMGDDGAEEFCDWHDGHLVVYPMPPKHR